MDIQHHITDSASAQLTEVMAGSGERDAVWLTTSAVSLASLTLALPLELSEEGGLRLVVAMIVALGMGWLATRLIAAWRGARARIWPSLPVTGLEPGSRLLSLSLQSVREITARGERVFRWRAFQEITEYGEWIALRVSDRECLVMPREGLAEHGLGDAETLAALITRGAR